MSATKGYRLDYYGDDIPEYLTTRAARLLLDYRSLHGNDRECDLLGMRDGICPAGAVWLYI